MKDDLNPYQLAIVKALKSRRDKQITLETINLLPVFDGLREPRRSAQSAKTGLISKGIIRMKRRGVYEIND